MRFRLASSGIANLIRRVRFSLLSQFVHETDDWTVYTVDSLDTRRKNATPYLVDLLDFNANGSCTCPNFYHNLQPILEREGAKEGPITCKHIRLARTVCLNRILMGELSRRAGPFTDKRKTYFLKR